MLQVNVNRSGLVFVSRTAMVVLLALVVGGCASGRQATEPETLSALGVIQNYESRHGRVVCNTLEANVRVVDEDEVHARYMTRDASPFGSQQHVRRAAKLMMRDGRWHVAPDPLGALVGG